jgi:hypothetical protein
MAKYLYSYRVPADFAPGAETSAEWEAWLGGGIEVGPVMEGPAS